MDANEQMLNSTIKVTKYGQIKQAIRMVEKQAVEIVTLKAENKKLRKCLEFYADKTNWDIAYEYKIRCSGKRARQCLKELEE